MCQGFWIKAGQKEPPKKEKNRNLMFAELFKRLETFSWSLNVLLGIKEEIHGVFDHF
jgi:hypothetical protein